MTGLNRSTQVANIAFSAGLTISLSLFLFASSAAAESYNQRQKPPPQAQPTYDYSTPARTLASLLRAYERKDADGVVQAQVLSSWEHKSAQEKAQVFDRSFIQHPERTQELKQILDHATALNEGSLPHLIRKRYGLGKYQGSLDGPRYMTFLLDHPRAKTRTVIRFLFVHSDGHWKLVQPGWTPFDGWSYDLSTPQAACTTVCGAVNARDYSGVFDLLGATPKIQKAEYEQLMARRERADPGAEAPHRKVIQPVFARAAINVKRLLVEGVPDDQSVVRVWKLAKDDPESRRLGFETFKKVGDEWRWMPKENYIWHISPTDADLSQEEGP